MVVRRVLLPLYPVDSAAADAAAAVACSRDIGLRDPLHLLGKGTGT